MDLLLREELDGKVCTNVDAFFERFFPPPELPFALDVWTFALQSGLYGETDRKWAQWPSKPSEKAISEWFHIIMGCLVSLQQANLHPRRGVTPCGFVSSGHLPLLGGDCVRKTDLALTTTPPAPNKPPDRHIHWKSVRVVGELKENPAEAESESTRLQLANYVREIFGVQHSRRCVHAFTLCGTKFRAWLFDRSGACTSRLVDVHQDAELFLRVICSYATMDATAIGFDPTIQWMRGDVVEAYDSTFVHRLAASSPAVPLPDPCIRIPNLRSTPHRQGPRLLTIDPIPLGSRYAIVSRATVIWKAAGDDGREYIVKDQWRAEERQCEGELWQQIAPGTCGLPQYEWHSGDDEGEVIDIAHSIRREPCLSLRGATSVSSSPRKRSPPSEPAEGQPRKKRSLGTLDRCPAKLVNRIYSRLVLSPVGRPLWKATSWTQLLQALHDAVRGHRYLYQSLGILHRDVSIGNVLLAQLGYHCTGILIDLDMAIHRDRAVASGARHRTGTLDFMAAGVLMAEAVHSPLHDLESFLYVLIWITTFYDLSKGDSERALREPQPNPLFPRDAGSRRNRLSTLGAAKSGLMSRGKTFRRMVLPALIPIAADGVLSTVLLEWRQALFRLDDEDDEDEDSLPSDEHVDEVYATVLGVLERGMDALGRPAAERP